jgi:hypothetical protein
MEIYVPAPQRVEGRDSAFHTRLQYGAADSPISVDSLRHAPVRCALRRSLCSQSQEATSSLEALFEQLLQIHIPVLGYLVKETA